MSIVEAGTGRLLGTVDGGAAHATVHAGAVYLHRGETYVVDELDLEDACARRARRPARLDDRRPATSPTSRIVVDRPHAGRLGTVTAHTGVVDVTNQVVAYQRRRLGTGEVLGEFPLDLPPASCAPGRSG